MASFSLTRLLAPTVLAAGLGLAALAPSPARADDDLVRVIVDVADVIYHGGQPYYRYGDGDRYGYGNRVVIVRDRYHRPTYYRYVPRQYYRTPPRGNAYGYYRNNPHYVRYVDRDRYYRYDRYDRYDRDRHDRHDRRDRWDDDDRRWRRHDGRRHHDDD